MNRTSALKAAKRLVGTPRRIAAVTTMSVITLFWLAFVHYTDYGHVGIMRDVFSGEIKLDTPGWNVSAPWVEVAKVDTRPMRVCVTSAGRGYDCKLVQFVPTEYREFVTTEGFYYYWWANRVSFNWGYDEEYRGTRDLLRGYGYSAKKYPFVKVLQEYRQ